MKPIDLDIIENFSRNFEHLKDKPIVIYGLGEKTKLIIETFKDYNIIGLMDRDKTGDCFGLPILDKSTVVAKAYCIIIVCAMHNLETIYKRIENWTSENSINVFHLNGTLLEKRKRKNCTEFIKKIDNYKKTIEKNDIISFDLFDTLVTRRFLYSTDVWAKVEEISEVSFFEEYRKKSEIIAQEKYGDAYNLDNIYNEFKNLTNNLDVSKLKKLEIEIELENVLPRKDVVDLLQYACTLKKKVILVSDTYLSKDIIVNILNKCGIRDSVFSDIYISNEFGKSKLTGDLWDLVVSENEEKRILHFGDNEQSDLKNALNHGINVLPIYSCLHLALNILDNKWLDYEKKLIDRVLMGGFISKIFNSPFSIIGDGVVQLDSLRELGSNFFGVLIKSFMDKLFTQAKQKKQKIVFQARDCWILKQIADIYYKNFDVKNVYLLTSRRAIAIQSIKTERDIDVVCEIFKPSCKYSFSEFCKIIFNITISEDDKYFDVLISDIDEFDLKDYIKNHYKKEILNEAYFQRTCFEKYLNDLGINLSDELAIVNFVGSGGTQFFFEKYGFKERSEYYYFALAPLRIELDDLSKTIALFGASSNFTGKNNPVAERTMVGECIFTSPKTQFLGFRQNGLFEFADDEKNGYYEVIKECHDGIFEYVKNNTDVDFSDVSVDLVNIIFGYMFDEHIVFVNNEIKKAFKLKDMVKSEEVVNAW